MGRGYGWPLVLGAVIGLAAQPFAWGSVSVSVNGVNYTIPQTNERNWGTNVTSWIQAISANTLQPSGGTFTLGADIDFGASFGLKSLYYKTRTANPSTTGNVRLATTDSFGWRNFANSGDLLLSKDASDNLNWNGHPLVSSTGIVPIAAGGTGQVTANAALNALLPSQATNATKVLTTDGTNTAWGAPTGDVTSNTATSVDAEIALFNSTTGKQIKRATGTGAVSVASGVYTAGTLAHGNGGTDVTSPGTKGNVLMSDGSNWLATAPSSRNYIYNAEFRYFQRQVTASTLTTFTDTSYGPDRWRLFTEQASGQVAQVTESITGDPSLYVVNVRQNNASNGRIMIGQALPKTDTFDLRGKTVQFSFWARTDGTEITTLRAAILEWTGSADVPTADVVSVWGATPTWAASYTADNTPADITISSAWSQATVSATVGASANNLVLVVWTPNQEVQNDDFYFGHPQLTTGAIAQPWSHIAKSEPVDHQEAMSFYWRQYGVSWLGSGYFDTTTSVFCYIPFPAQMYKVPITGFSGNSDALIARPGTSNSSSSAAGTYNNTTQRGTQFQPTAASAATAGQGTICGVGANAGAYFEANAEL
jgi:hypothetical protein